MQNILPVQVINRSEDLSQDLVDLGRGQSFTTIFQCLQKIETFDIIQRHIGGIIIFEYLMHTDDIRVLQFCQAFGLLDKQIDDRLEFGLMCARPCANPRIATPAQGIGETFLDHNPAIQGILCQIGDAKATTVQEFLDDILAMKKLCSRLQLINKVVFTTLLDNLVNLFYRRNHLAAPPGLLLNLIRQQSIAKANNCPKNLSEI